MKRIISTLLFSSLVLVSACGGLDSDESTSEGSDATESTSSETTSANQFNDADVDFVQGMIPHHDQAVEMADLALTNAGSGEVKALAEEIKAAQGPEIETMQTWLEAWGEQTSDMSGGMEGMEDDRSGMSDQDMDALEGKSGSEFDPAFLTMMIEHHKGAIEMSETELAEGENPDARRLANEIITAQEAEITRMEELLAAGS